MSNKSILVIDTPSSCKMCPLSCYNEMYNEHMCQGTLGKNTYARTIGIYGGDRPEWCPLSPLPEYVKIPQISRGDSKSMTNTVKTMYGLGYNQCLNDLLGKKEETNER